jgi:hypothetical protein
MMRVTDPKSEPAFRNLPDLDARQLCAQVWLAKGRDASSTQSVLAEAARQHTPVSVIMHAVRAGWVRPTANGDKLKLTAAGIHVAKEALDLPR